MVPAERGFGRFPYEEVEPLIAALDDPEEAVRLAVLRALWRLGAYLDRRTIERIRPLAPYDPQRVELRSITYVPSDEALTRLLPDLEKLRQVVDLYPAPQDYGESFQQLSSEAASRYITESFAALACEKFPYDHWSHIREGAGDVIAERVSLLGGMFRPEIQSLFYVYATLQERVANEKREFLAQMQRQDNLDTSRNWPGFWPWGPVTVSWQIAWATSRAGVRAVLRAIAPEARDGAGGVRWAAAQFIEESIRWASRSEALTFGGGAGPEDVDLSMWRTDRLEPFERLLNAPSPLSVAWEDEAPRPTQSAPPTDDLPGAARQPPPAPAPARSVESATHEPITRVVNTGFSDFEFPEVTIPSPQSLRAKSDYWFWVEIGEPQRDSIEVTPTALPDSIPMGAVLTVAVFSFENELILDDDADIGAVRLTGATGSEVVNQPGRFEYRFANNPIRKSRLFFPLKTPSKHGAHRLRCNIYYQHVLVQSRIVTAWVGPAPDEMRALSSVLDYKLSHSLDPARLARMGSNTLSVFVNDNSNGSHGFYFEGEQQVKTQASLDAQTLQDSLTQVRKTLRTVAWGSPDPWQKSFPYRYGRGGEPDFFANDLIDLAIRGYMLYSALIDQISGGPEDSQQLVNLMLKPGRVQISSKESARFVVPAALFYDRPLDTQLKQIHLCDAFLETVRGKGDLAGSACFQGSCPHLDELDVVCPSGFWGYRHQLGLPVSIELQSVGEAEPDIEFNDPAAMLVIVSLDKMFVEREPHEEQLRTSRTPLSFTLCEDRSQALSALQNPQAQMVYFYCHGGMTANNTPYLNIGNDEYITPDNLRAYKIRWKSPRPLVFLNGCMTTALEPEKAIEFVSAFVNQAAASGVIGTEITIFEPLATEFAEAFMKYFMGECKPIGLSIKLARLALLQRFNPLGLVYIPFALPGLHLVDLRGGSH